MENFNFVFEEILFNETTSEVLANKSETETTLSAPAPILCLLKLFWQISGLTLFSKSGGLSPLDPPLADQ